MAVSPSQAGGLTGHVVAEDAGGDDAAVGGEHALQVLLGHRLRQAADVQVGSLDGFRAGPGVRHLPTRRQSVSQTDCHSRDGTYSHTDCHSLSPTVRHTNSRGRWKQNTVTVNVEQQRQNWTPSNVARAET